MRGSHAIVNQNQNVTDRYTSCLVSLKSKFICYKMQYSESNFEYSWSIFDYSERKSCGKVAIIVFFSYFSHEIMHQEWHMCPPTGLNRIVGSGGKAMRVNV